MKENLTYMTMDSHNTKVAVITGANTERTFKEKIIIIFCNRKCAVYNSPNDGIGFTLAQRLLEKFPQINICLACRNQDKGSKAAKTLTDLFPGAIISVIILDTSSVKSVYSAADNIRKQYGHIDYLYLNAGVMNVTGVDWQYFWKGCFSNRIFYMFTTGEGLLCQSDNVTEDGLQCVFETNLFGHYVLIKELEDRLGNVSGKDNKPSQIIWTSSKAAQKSMFNIDDFQHKKGKDPYSSSKYAIDVLSVGLNEKLNELNVYSHSVCPGLVMTNMTYGILPQWFWMLFLPFMWLLRIFVPSMTNTTFKGTEALVWLSEQDPAKLDPQTKYMSHVTTLNSSYVAQEKMNISPDLAERFIKELDEIDQSLRLKHKK